jgi:hypothetical protein
MVPRYIVIDGKRHAWRDILALRREQRRLPPSQATPFELRDDARPPTERTAAGRYLEPTLFERAVSAEKIRTLNDAFRTTMTGGRVMMTAGVEWSSGRKTRPIRRKQPAC